MSKKTYSPEVIISKLREVEVMQSQGCTQEEAIRQIGVTVCQPPFKSPVLEL